MQSKQGTKFSKALSPESIHVLIFYSLYQASKYFKAKYYEVASNFNADANFFSAFFHSCALDVLELQTSSSTPLDVTWFGCCSFVTTVPFFR